MHPSEILIIYMAIAAPHGVAFFLQQKSDESLTKRLFKASGATLLWPLVWLRSAGKNGHTRAFAALAKDHLADDPNFAKTEIATRQLLTAFDETVELLRLTEVERNARATYEFRELLETYVGLTRIAAANSVHPSTREMETARLAGRRGDDLLLAGLCVHRRNDTRLAAHLDIARNRFLQTLIELHRHSPDGLSLLLADSAGKHELSERILRIYVCAIDLTSLLEDRAAVLRIAHLLDTECASLRALEASTTKDASTLFSHEEETCLTTRAGHTVPTACLPNETFTQA